MSKTREFTDSSFTMEVLGSDQPVLVDFWAAWCGPCHAVGPTIEELAEQYEGTVKVGKLNIDENPQTASGFGIRSIPAVLLFKDGKLVETLIGVQPKERYQQALQNLGLNPGVAACRLD
ncbi:MAG: thioredoxin [Acidobacteria bacterium]|nr:thioredoxin [Acidobacteriota bacterium]